MKFSYQPIERLTSTLVEKEIGWAGVNRKKRAQKVDSPSAVLILQNFLELKS